MKSTRSVLFMVLLVTAGFISCVRNNNESFYTISPDPGSTVPLEMVSGEISRVIAISDEKGRSFPHVKKAIYHSGLYFLQVGWENFELVILDSLGNFVSKAGSPMLGNKEY